MARARKVWKARKRATRGMAIPDMAVGAALRQRHDIEQPLLDNGGHAAAAGQGYRWIETCSVRQLGSFTVRVGGCEACLTAIHARGFCCMHEALLSCMHTQHGAMQKRVH